MDPPRLRGRFPDQFDEIDAAALERGANGWSAP